MLKIKTPANFLNWQKIGWKYYNRIKKKAMEQESSWAGLAISLSIAFFIVIVSAQGLSLIYQSLKHNRFDFNPDQKIYRLENIKLLNPEAIIDSVKIPDNTSYLV